MIKKFIPLIIILIGFIVAFLSSPYLPSQLASHWDARGLVNGYSSKLFGLYFIPVLSLCFYFLFLFLPSIDPYKNNFKQFVPHYNNFVTVILGFFFYIHSLTIFWNLGYQFNMIQLLSPAFFGLFYFTATLIRVAKRNWFVGIRTPWTMSSDRVWRETHSLGGQLFKYVAFTCLVGLFYPDLAIFFLIIPVLGITLFLFIYSYVLYLRYN
ncbi:MAG: SdpI family protein [Microgenomates group bacterium]